MKFENIKKIYNFDFIRAKDQKYELALKLMFAKYNK